MQRASRTMLITGATGFIGSRLATLALSRGYSVRTLTRSDWASVPAVPVDQRYLGSLPDQIPCEALQGVDVVVHCAAHIEGGERAAFAVNVEGTIRLAWLARKAGARTFVFLSSQSARPDAVSSYGRTKYAAEQELLKESGLHVIILRPGLVTGPGSKGLFSRMSQAVHSLPIIPLLGGGRTIVQPIHVDDLCAAIFRCEERSADLNGAILHLGHPEGVRLAEFLRLIATERLGRRKPTLSIPIWPVEIAVKIAEALRIPLPINSNNLKGMKVVERMDTQADLKRLGIRLRPLPQMVQDRTDSAQQPASLKERAVRVLLIGAGRIGLVHAITLSRLHGAVLSGVTDPKPGATGLLSGMGVTAPMFRTLEEAVPRVKPDAAVIATPAATHLSLSRDCLAQGLALMIEKPLAVRKEQLLDFERLPEEFPTQPIQVGYVMPRNPQVIACLDRLRAGEFGRVLGFHGITLLSLIQQRDMNRWEVKREMSGGGAFINSGGHVLSMIRAAFGDPQHIEGQSLKLYSAEVEDSLVTMLTYPDFRGNHYCSWSINGYPRQENLLTIWTERGRLILTGSVGVFVSKDGEVDITHQLDFNVGFNIAPDYAGAGFTNELNDLKEAARAGRPAPMNLREGVQLERLLFRVYDVAQEVRQFAGKPSVMEDVPPAGLTLSHADVPEVRPSHTPRRVLDLRDLSTARVRAYLKEAADGSAWDEYLLSSSQMGGVPESWRGRQDLRVTVPDFLAQSRLLSTGRHVEVLKQMGPGGILGAVRAAASLLLSERGPTFWLAAGGLLGAALHSVPVGFRGRLLLHTYLTDFALALRRLDVLDKLLAMCRKLRPGAQVGFHTNMAAEALNALHLLETPVDEVSVLTSPRAVDMAALLGAMRQTQTPRPLRLTAEVGLAPSVVHRMASRLPHCWAFGADAVLLGLAADPTLAQQRQAEVEADWARAFPGVALPEGVL